MRVKTIDEEIFKKFKEEKMFASKNLGQNFLKNQEVLCFIESYCRKRDIRSVVEIGGGTGALTKLLCEAGIRVKVYELDRKYAELLNCLKEKYDKLEVVVGDFLKVSVGFIGNGDSVVANIPYNITTDILEKLYCDENIPKYSLLMVQKEFAKRIVKKENISVLNSFLSVFCDVQIARYVSKNDFFPRPKVDSALIGISPSLMVDAEKRNLYLLFLKKIFSSKRKRISKSLKVHFGVVDVCPFSDKRVEQISPANLFEVFEFVYDLKGSSL